MASTSTNDLAKTARGAVGVLGAGFSNAYKYIENDQNRYARSLDPDRRLPPSLFVSQRDGVRNGSVMPLSERCIEDFASSRGATQAPASAKLGDEQPIAGRSDLDLGSVS